MTEIAAIKSFLNNIATAYPNDNVPTDVAYPYITFEPIIGFWEHGDVPIQCHIWHRTDSDAAINKLVRDLADAIGYGGATVSCDNGWLWIKLGTPFSQPVPVPDDTTLKRRLVNLRIEFITNQ